MHSMRSRGEGEAMRRRKKDPFAPPPKSPGYRLQSAFWWMLPKIEGLQIWVRITEIRGVRDGLSPASEKALSSVGSFPVQTPIIEREEAKDE